jgi:hypothetical protein
LRAYVALINFVHTASRSILDTPAMVRAMLLLPMIGAVLMADTLSIARLMLDVPSSARVMADSAVMISLLIAASVPVSRER